MNLKLFGLFLALCLIAAGIAGSCVLWRAAEIGELVRPLEHRAFPRLTVVTVGTGGSYENPERRGPCTAIGWGHRIFLVDAGRGVAEGLRLSKIPVSQPATVLLTNLMPQNTQGLDDLIFTGWLANLTISAGALPGGSLPALAYRFKGLHRSVVVSGTGWAPDALVEFAMGADMLVHEAVYIPTPEDIENAGVIADPKRLRLEAALHTSLLDVGELAGRARVKTLVLVRMRPPPFFDLQLKHLIDDHFDGTISFPEDGDELTP